MPYLKIENTVHRCEFPKQSNSTLPKLPPQAGKFSRWLRGKKELFIVSGSNFRANLVYRSIHSLQAEKRRHTKYFPWYIIHPFSKLYAAHEAVMAVTWSISYFKDPYTVAFFHKNDISIVSYWQIINLIVDFTLLMHVVFCCFSGYFLEQTKTVELQHSKIIKRYLRTYFIFDFLGALPLNIVYIFIITRIGSKETMIIYLLSLVRLLRIVRCKSLLLYIKRITHWFKISDGNYVNICLVILGTFLTHWGACILIILPTFHKYWYSEYNRRTWIHYIIQAQDSRSYRYLYATYIFLRHFLTVAPMRFNMRDPFERIVVTLSVLTGTFYIAIILILTFLRNKGVDVSSNKYEEFLQQIQEYTKRKKLPPYMKSRLLIYFEHRFQKQFFDENKILDTISLHLKYEVVLNRCKHIFQSVSLFQGLPKSILGFLVASFSFEIFLENDVILHGEDHYADCMFFISYGTVAVYNTKGLEICHIEDGDFFGEVRLLYPERGISFHFVAADTSEVFRLKKEDFMYCIQKFREFRTKIDHAIVKNLEYLEMKEKQISEQKIRSEDILYELRHGKILEQNKKRNRYNEKRFD